jgi:hypothetical protein
MNHLEDLNDPFGDIEEDVNSSDQTSYEDRRAITEDAFCRLLRHSQQRDFTGWPSRPRRRWANTCESRSNG